MTTFLAQNQFISNSGTPPSPAVPDTAGVAPQPPVAPAGTISVSDGVLGSSLPSVEMELSATEATAPSETEGAVSVSTASSDNLGCLTAADEALYWQLRHADNPFTRDLPDVPDPQAFFDQIDPPPLFLQRQA